MKKIILLIIISSLFIISCCEKSTKPSDADIVEALEIIRDSLEIELGHIVQSISVYIQTSDDVHFATTTLHERDQITPETYFRFASNTKNFTATAMLNMFEDGWLDIYDTIIDTIPGTEIPYVPTIPAWDIPYKNEITIEQLLQHSAGVYDVDNDVVPNCGDESYVYYIFSADPSHQFTAEELVNQVTINNLYYFPPGTDYHYSNTGYTILSEIIARVYSAHTKNEKTYADYLEDYICGPNTPVPVDIHFPYEATDVALPDPHVCGLLYETNGDTIFFDETNISSHVAEGNGYGNFEDINTYIRTLMTGQNVLEPETITLMQTDVSSSNPGYGLGCTHTTNIGYGHNGCIRGYFTIMAYDPDHDLSMIVLLPTVDMTSEDKFIANFMSMYDAAWKARELLGYPGKP
ncbi:beta-lactamase family protein [bacterium]|nr:beta-lactamase family protein [bacterium]